MATFDRTSRANGESRATITTSILSTTVAFALSRGMDIEDIEAEARVSALDLMNYEARIPDEVLPRLWRALSQRYPEAPLSLEAARAAPLTALAGLAHGAQFAQDLRAALQLLIDHRSVLADRLLLELRPADPDVAFVLSHPLDAMDQGRAAEAGAALIWRLITEVLEIEGALVRVEFQFGHQGPKEAYLEFFGAPVQFGCTTNALILRAASLHQPASQANLQLFAFVREYFGQALRRLEGSPEPSDLASLRGAILGNARRGEFTAAAAAARAQLSLRAAQRVAANHGMSVSGLIDEVREASARRFLSDRSIAVEKVASLVGYSDDRAFRRAFKRWTGLSPSEFRRRQP